MKKILIILTATFLPHYASSQKRSIQLTPVSYDFYPYTTHNLAKFNGSTSIYYQSTLNGKWHLVAGILFIDKFIKDECKNCFDTGEGTLDMRQFTPSIGVKYYILNKDKNLNLYIESGLLYSNYKLDHQFVNYAWGASGFISQGSAKGFGAYLRPGIEIDIRDNIFLGLNGYWSLNRMKQDFTITNYFDYRNQWESTGTNWMVTTGLEFRVGYRF